MPDQHIFWPLTIFKDLKDATAIQVPHNNKCALNKSLSFFSLSLRMEIAKRVQGPEESFGAWFSDLKDLSAKCDFERDCCEDCRNSRLLDQILVGLSNKSIRKKLMAVGSTLSLDQAVNAIRRFEDKEVPQMNQLAPDIKLGQIHIKTESPTASVVAETFHQVQTDISTAVFSDPMSSSTPAKNLQSWPNQRTLLHLSSVSNNNPTITNDQSLTPTSNILHREDNSVSTCLESLSKNRSISVKSVNLTPIPSKVESRVKNGNSSLPNNFCYLIRNNSYNPFPALHVKSEQDQDRRRTNSSGSYVQPEKRSRIAKDLNDSIEIIDKVDTEQPIFTCQDCKETFSKQIAINKHECKKLDINHRKSTPDIGKLISNLTCCFVFLIHWYCCYIWYLKKKFLMF